MNKLPLFLAVVAIAIAAFSIFNSPKSDSLVYVDVNKLMDGYDRTKVERDKFLETEKTLRANVDSLMVDWENEIKQYEKNRASMSKKELNLKQELLSNKQQQISNYQTAIQKQIQEEDQKASQTVVNDINDFVKEYGKKNDYKIIFGASGAGSIMYANDASDLTVAVLEGLNKEYNGIN